MCRLCTTSHEVSVVRFRDCMPESLSHGRFREGGWSAVEEELALEMLRLWKRNLGRDDRLISDHGREVRLPFLDEDVVEFLKRLPLSFLLDPAQPRGKSSLNHLA